MNWTDWLLMGGFVAAMVCIVWGVRGMLRIERRATVLLADCGRLLEQVQSHAPCSKLQLRKFFDELADTEAHLSGYIDPEADCSQYAVSWACQEFATLIDFPWTSPALMQLVQCNRLRAEKAAEAKEEAK